MVMEQERRHAMGSRIKDLREGKRLRQQAVADAVGVTLRAYQAWEAGDTGIKWENAESLAGVLDTTASYILHGPELEEAPSTPDPFSGEDRLWRLERQQDEIHAQVIRNGRLLNAVITQLTGADQETMQLLLTAVDEAAANTSDAAGDTQTTPEAPAPESADSARKR